MSTAPTSSLDLGRALRQASWRRIGGVWALILLFDVARHVVDTYLDGSPPSPVWIGLAAGSIALWAVATPPLFWLGRRVPFTRAGWRRALAVHAAAYAALTLADALLQWVIYLVMTGNRRASFASTFVAQLLLAGFAYGAVVAIGHAFDLAARDRERARRQAELEQALAAARLRALEMQLRPHFLYNALHTVGALVRAARHDDAVRSLAALGDLLRAALDGDDAPEVALADELAFARRYLDLQQLRYADRLQVHLAPAGDVADALVPRLLLQPLLENAMRHGVERSTGAVAVAVDARRAGDRLIVVVRDHGGTRHAPRPGRGIGLRNTRARLAALHGDAQQLALEPLTGGGLAVTIELPLRWAPREATS